MPLRTVRFAATALSPILLWFVPLCATLIATPVIVRELGPVQYGAYSLVAAAAAFAVLPSSYAAVARFTTGHAANGGMPAGLLAKIATAQVAAVALNIAALILVDSFFDLQLPVHSVAGHAAWIGCVALTLLGTAASQLYFGALQHFNRWSVAAAILLASGVALPFAGLFLARAGASWLELLAAQGMILFGATALLSIAYYRAIRVGGPQTEAASISNIARYMARAGFAGMIGSLMAIGERLIISSAYGPAEAGHFALAMALAMLIHAMMNAANLRLPAQLSKTIGLPERQVAETQYRKAMRLTFGATVLALLLAVTLGSRFLTLWLGEAPGLAAAPLLPWLSLGMAGLAIAVPPWILADVIGVQKLNIRLMLGMGLTWLATCLIVTLLLPGAIAVAIARGATAACLIPHIMSVERAAFGAFRAKWWAKIVLQSLLAAIGAFAVIRILHLQGAEGIIFPVVAASGTYFFIAYATGLVSIADMKPEPVVPS